jgi:predicted PurR-regulated permease PerM
MTIFDMPYAILISVIIGITALVPIVGAFVGCAIGACFILVVDPMAALWFIVLFLVLQQIEGNLIYPRVVGNSVGLPGMWVLLAVAVGSELMGVPGMLIMIPLASVCYALARELTDKRLAKRNIAREKLQDQPIVVDRPIVKRKLKKSVKYANKNTKANEETVNDEASDSL